MWHQWYSRGKCYLQTMSKKPGVNLMSKHENDENVVRTEILKFLARGAKRRTKGYKTTEIESELKPSGYKQGEVRSNLLYLVDNDFVVREETDRSFVTKGGARQPSTEVKYRISAKGTDFMNGQESPFTQNSGKYAGIKIENVSGTVILGDKNIVSQQAIDIVKPLNDLVNAVTESTILSDDEKNDYLSELATLDGALKKREPNRNVIKAVVDALSPLSNVAKISSFLLILMQALSDGNLLN